MIINNCRDFISNYAFLSSSRYHLVLSIKKPLAFEPTLRRVSNIWEKKLES